MLPLAHEPIVKQDGNTKNDCETNAAKRLVPQIRQLLPKEKVAIVEDALSANEHSYPGIEKGKVPLCHKREARWEQIPIWAF